MLRLARAGTGTRQGFLFLKMKKRELPRERGEVKGGPVLK